jgi:hypothetical protein
MAHHPPLSISVSRKEGQIVSRRNILAASAATALLCASAILPTMQPTQVRAQANPVMTNVIPEGGNYAVQGKVQTINPAAGTLTIVHASNRPLPLKAGPGVDLADAKLEVGDSVSAHYTRSVALEIASPQTRVSDRGASETVGQLARKPGGVGPDAMNLKGVVTQINGGSSFDLVDASGGGVYTIQVTNPARVALVQQLKVGDTVTAVVTPLTLTSVAKCGWFGC